MPETKPIPKLVQFGVARSEAALAAAPDRARKREPAKTVSGNNDGAPRTLSALNALIAKSPSFVSGSARAVLGEGPLRPLLAFVGEQPGDQEDLQGRPFVGPAGQLLTRAMEAAGVSREACYLTNAVKHFKYEQRGKRRLHKTPTAGEVRHYRWWLDRELELVKPKLVVALGATAVLALAGKALPIGKVRGPMTFDAMHGMPGFVTVHPSYLLRIPDAAAKRDAYEAFVADLKAANRRAQRLSKAAS